jgi:uncharacterized membrane protein (UPF0127 family)
MRLARFVRRLPVLPALLLLSTAAPACRSSGNPIKAEQATTADLPSGATVVIPAAARSVTFRVELARTPEEVSRGLMFRPHLDPDAGMLFLFEGQEVHNFWMKNTLIPLDMLFIDRDGKIVGIVENAEPQTLTSRRVDQPSKYVLEIGGGVAARLGIRSGTKVEFRDVGGL